MIKGLHEKLGLTGTSQDIKPSVRMAALLARTKSDGQVYAGTVPHAEKQRRRAANRRAGASRRTNRGRR